MRGIVISGEPSSQRLEIPDQMRLVRVATRLCKLGQRPEPTGMERSQHVPEANQSDHPLRRHAELIQEAPFQGTDMEPQLRGELVDADLSLARLEQEGTGPAPFVVDERWSRLAHQVRQRPPPGAEIRQRAEPLGDGIEGHTTQAGDLGEPIGEVGGAHVREARRLAGEEADSKVLRSARALDAGPLGRGTEEDRTRTLR